MSNLRITIKAIELADMPALCELLGAAQVAADYFEDGFADPSRIARRWSVGSGKLLLAARLYDDQRLVAVVRISRCALSYAVNPALWRQGLGTAIVGAACEMHDAAGGEAPLTAVVAETNIASRRLLERLGFNVTEVCATRAWLSYHRPSRHCERL